jgi:hypothetical protein
MALRHVKQGIIITADSGVSVLGITTQDEGKKKNRLRFEIRN